jgi:long-chain acyl-CoA synthetase
MSDTLQEFVFSLQSYGERPALKLRTEFRSFTWTYNELARRVRASAHLLAENGVHHGDRVLFWAPNSPTWVSTYFACLAAGFVPVPLDLHSTPDFVERVATETEARLLVRGRYQPHVALRARAILVDEIDWETRASQPEFTNWPRVTPADLAEIMYTSGTTAQPKGVMLTHGNLCANLEGIQPIIPREPFYRLVSLLPLSHAFEQVIGLLLPLGRGGQITYLVTLKPSALMESLRQEKPNALVLVPRFLELLHTRLESHLPTFLRETLHRLTPLLLDIPLSTRRTLSTPLRWQLGGCLKYFVVGGAPLDVSLERSWDALGVLVLQGYRRFSEYTHGVSHRVSGQASRERTGQDRRGWRDSRTGTERHSRLLSPPRRYEDGICRWVAANRRSGRIRSRRLSLRARTPEGRDRDASRPESLS